MIHLDTTKIGYNFRGAYIPPNASLSNEIDTSSVMTFKNRDVVYYNGGAYEYMDNVFSPMALGQQLITSKGSIVNYNGNRVGVKNQSLYSTGSDIEYMFGIDRNGTIVKALPTVSSGSTDATGGENFALTIMADGSVRGWGRAIYGSLGNGDNSDIGRSKPTVVGFPPDAPAMVKIFLGSLSWFSIDEEGGVWACGYNGQSNLGVGDAVNRYTPVKLNGNGDLPLTAKVTKVSVGTGHDEYRNAVIITEDGYAYFVGQSRYGSSGVGHNNTCNVPTIMLRSKMLVAEGKKVVDCYAFGHYHGGTWLIDNTGVLYAAGEQNTIGRMRNNGNADNAIHEAWPPSLNRPVKKVIGCESDHHAVSGFDYYRMYMIIFQDGGIATWGNNSYTCNVPGAEEWVATIDTRISDVKDGYVQSGGYQRLVVLKNDGTVWGIGYNGYYNLGTTTGDHTTWQQFTSPKMVNIAKIQGFGYYYTTSGAALTTDGKMIMYGCKSAGSWGNGYNMSELVPSSWDYVSLPKKIVDFWMYGYMGAGSDYSAVLALAEDGTLYSWGNNDYGKLGLDDDNENLWSPSPVKF